MTPLKSKILCLVPMILGGYCLVQALLLLASGDLLAQALAVMLLLWVPGCAYYAWRGRTAFSKAAITTQDVRRAVPAGPRYTNAADQQA